MAVRMNLDRVEYREPSTRAMRWLIFPSRRKQIIRLRVIGVRSPIDCCAASCCGFPVFRVIQIVWPAAYRGHDARTGSR
jgi:hypothetical protein